MEGNGSMVRAHSMPGARVTLNPFHSQSVQQEYRLLAARPMDLPSPEVSMDAGYGSVPDASYEPRSIGQPEAVFSGKGRGTGSMGMMPREESQRPTGYGETGLQTERRIPTAEVGAGVSGTGPTAPKGQESGNVDDLQRALEGEIVTLLRNQNSMLLHEVALLRERPEKGSGATSSPWSTVNGSDVDGGNGQTSKEHAGQRLGSGWAEMVADHPAYVKGKLLLVPKGMWKRDQVKGLPPMEPKYQRDHHLATRWEVLRCHQFLRYLQMNMGKPFMRSCMKDVICQRMWEMRMWNGNQWMSVVIPIQNKHGWSLNRKICNKLWTVFQYHRRFGSLNTGLESLKGCRFHLDRACKRLAVNGLLKVGHSALSRISGEYVKKFGLGIMTLAGSALRRFLVMAVFLIGLGMAGLACSALCRFLEMNVFTLGLPTLSIALRMILVMVLFKVGLSTCMSLVNAFDKRRWCMEINVIKIGLCMALVLRFNLVWSQRAHRSMAYMIVEIDALVRFLGMVEGDWRMEEVLQRVRQLGPIQLVPQPTQSWNCLTCRQIHPHSTSGIGCTYVDLQCETSPK